VSCSGCKTDMLCRVADAVCWPPRITPTLSSGCTAPHLRSIPANTQPHISNRSTLQQKTL
jgi:hypothetical protein